ncbi:hypothetical protein C8F01DRAFT_563737 [Mycena amicta]|nr:hypothetical protein C8F01DRAFT_563737 [Mycena amicta]
MHAVPKFWSGPWPEKHESQTTLPALGLQLFISIFFGAIHCLAWSLHFPSLVELWMWRASAVILTAMPLLTPLLAICYSNLKDSWLRTTLVTGNQLLAVSYVLARAVLLVLPFTTLRSLPPGVFVDFKFSWTSLIPHV